MATSPIYSWPEPDNTDLVKNGALAIRTLGNAIDTTMATMTPKTIVDAKGDLIAASAADTPARLAVGANDLVLTAASGEATGLKYAGAWTNYTPTWTGLNVGNGTVNAKYCQIGKIVKVSVIATFGSTTSISGGFVQLSGPVAGVQTARNVGLVYFEDAGVAGYSGIMKQDATATFSVCPVSTSGNYAGVSSLSSTVPFTWATGDFFECFFSYQAA